MKLRNVAFSWSGELKRECLKNLGRALGVSAVAGAFVLGSLSPLELAEADELRIKDKMGSVQLLQDVPSGISSDLLVTLRAKESSALAPSIAQVEISDGAVKRQAMANNSGVARFKNIPSGQYTITLGDSAASFEIASVSVEGGQTAFGNTAKRDDIASSRAMYAVGATAVAGGIATAIVAGSGSSSSTAASTAGASLGLLNSGGATLAGPGAAALEPLASAEANNLNDFFFPADIPANTNIQLDNIGFLPSPVLTGGNTFSSFEEENLDFDVGTFDPLLPRDLEILPPPVVVNPMTPN